LNSLIENDKIRVNEKIVNKKSYLIKENDLIIIQMEDEQQKAESSIPEAEDISLKIVYEDEYLAVIDKPSGMTVHPAPGNYQGTLVNALLFHFKEKLSSGSENSRPGIVHRLDKDTSGLLIIAKNDKVHAQLSKMLQNKEIHKKYKAIVVGILKEKSAQIALPIGRSTKDRKKMAITDKGKMSITNYQVEKEYEYFSLIDVELITGRTHQIRVHFAHLNCPILGDSTYNSTIQSLSRVPVNEQRRLQSFLKNNLKRQALHAYYLRFMHPVLKKEIELFSEYPDDLKETVLFMEKNFT
jgi:23S rRNA pseudouridine1911/1915/1917 synthase